MKRMPKFTSRMFKPKMKRFGGESPKMPRMPRIKKFAKGGDTDDLVPPSMLPDENAAELAARARGSKGPSRRYRSKPQKYRPNIPPQFKGESIVTPEAYEEQVKEDKSSEAAAQREFERRIEMLEQKRREEMQRREYEDYMARKRPILRARQGGSVKGYRAGGAIKSSASRRADGIASKGKTKGRMI